MLQQANERRDAGATRHQNGRARAGSRLVKTAHRRANVQRVADFQLLVDVGGSEAGRHIFVGWRRG